MSEEYQQKKTLGERLKDSYQIKVVHEETLQETRSYRVSKAKLYAMISLFILAVAGIVVSLLFFTPLRQLVPGYADVNNNQRFFQLNNQIDELEQEVNEQSTYIEGLLSMISSPSAEEKLLDAEENEGAIISLLDQMFFVPPIKGTIEAGYSLDKGHLGTDIVAPTNTPVKSILDGYVVSSDWTFENGNTISIQHEHNILSIYKHNSILLKEAGNKVKAGEAVAIIGNSGENTSGPHLHFELWFEGKAVDAEHYINF